MGRFSEFVRLQVINCCPISVEKGLIDRIDVVSLEKRT